MALAINITKEILNDFEFLLSKKQYLNSNLHE